MDHTLYRGRTWILMAIVLLSCGVGSLWAHAILMQSTPARNSTVNGPEVPVTLRFNVRIDGSRSRLRLVSPVGQETALPAKQSGPDTLQAQAAGLKPGAYKLLWQVLASDGHMSRGEVDFTVK